MSEFFLGQIVTVGFNFAPAGAARCDGQTVAISQNTALFNLIGTTYGGDGVSTFLLPDLRGRRMNHQGTLQGVNSTYVVGQTAGVTQRTLTAATILSHSHTGGSISAATKTATEEAPVAGAVLGTSADISGNANLAKPAIYCPPGTSAGVALAGLNVSATNTGFTGGAQPFSVLDPFLVINMIIMLQGIFPSQN